MKKAIFTVIVAIGLVGLAHSLVYANSSMVHLNFNGDTIPDYLALIRNNMLNYEYKGNNYLTIVRLDRFIANYFRMLIYMGYYWVAPFILKLSESFRKNLIASLQISQLVKKL